MAARFTASIDDKVKAQLDTFAKDYGYNRSEALELMIRAFFEAKADAPQTSSSPSPSPSPEAPPAALDQARLEALEARLDRLQGQLRVSSPVNVRMDLVEMETRLKQTEGFLLQQHRYVEGLHEVVVANVDAHLEVYNRYGMEQELYVPSVEPPTPDWAESSGE